MKTVAVLTACLPLLVAGCAEPEFILLKNPTTGQVAECHTYSAWTLAPIAQTAIDNMRTRSCARDYEAAGFQRLK